MSIPDFPISTLGRPSSASYTISLNNRRVRSETYSGLSTSYNASNANIGQIALKWECGAAQYASFCSWYAGDCKNGGSYFTIGSLYLFNTLGPITARFVNPPKTKLSAWNHYSIEATIETINSGYISESTLNAALPTDPHTDKYTFPESLFGNPEITATEEETYPYSKGSITGYSLSNIRRRSPQSITNLGISWEMPQDKKILFDAWLHYKIKDGADWFWLYYNFHGVWTYIKVRFTESIDISYNQTDWWIISGNLETIDSKYLPLADCESIYPSSDQSTPLTVKNQSSSGDYNEGESVILTVSPSGGGDNGSGSIGPGDGNIDYKYQWYKNGVTIEGADENSYTIPSVDSSSYGSYTCIITGTDPITGSSTTVVSDPIVINISNQIPPVITQNPVGGLYDEGNEVELFVIATGSPTLEYQWYKDSEIIEGANSSSYTITIGDDTLGGYYCVVSNSYGIATSSTANIWYSSQKIAITKQPTGGLVQTGETVVLTVAAVGTGTLRYQWYKGGVLINGATMTKYTFIASSTTAGDYYCTVTDDVESISSNSVTIAIAVKPTITTQPTNVTASYGIIISVGIIAEGTATLHYQWYKDDVIITGATSDTYSFLSSEDSDGEYYCIVSNSIGFEKSSIAQAVSIDNLIGVPIISSVDGLTSMFINSNGILYVTGDNKRYQLGLRDNINRSRLTQSATNVYKSATGNEDCFYISNSFTLYGVGYNIFGELGIGNTTQRTNWTTCANNVKSICSSYNSSLFINKSNELYGCGYNQQGQLGLGDSSNRISWTKTASSVKTALRGLKHSLYINTSKILYSTGNNGNGQLGLGNTTNKLSWTQTATNVSLISCGDYHSFYVDIYGNLYGCGLNSSGQLGLGDKTNRTSWTLCATNVAYVSTSGRSHSFYLTTNGNLYGCGLNSSGQLGLGDTTNRTSWTLCATNVAYVSSGMDFSIYLNKYGDLYAAGLNSSGQLGLGDINQRTSWTKLT